MYIRQLLILSVPSITAGIVTSFTSSDSSDCVDWSVVTSSHIPVILSHVIVLLTHHLPFNKIHFIFVITSLKTIGVEVEMKRAFIKQSVILEIKISLEIEVTRSSKH